jgi:molybdate transport system substrate-binding protein
VETGAAEIGIVSHSLVKGGRSWEVPRDAYPKMEQSGIIVKSSRHAAPAQEFRTFLLSERGRSILKRFGFYLPV